jgi:hypothetical protein
MSIVLSNRQNPMLQAFVSLKEGEYMTIEQAQQFDQRPFRSMLIRGWVTYKRSHGFYLTKEGRKAWYDYQNTDIIRKNPTLPLTSYFDMDHYGVRRTVKVREIPKQQVA